MAAIVSENDQCVYSMCGVLGSVSGVNSCLNYVSILVTFNFNFTF